MLNIALTSNEPRAKNLFLKLQDYCNVPCELDFDKIDPITKYLAAILSFKLPRAEWWGNYQMHPLVQRRRCNVLQKEMVPYREKIDAMLMWGSWFNPNKGLRDNKVPFFHYIDQSRSLRPILGEPQTSEWNRRKSFLLQAETYSECSGIFCMSKWARDQTLASHEIPEEKIHVVGWGPCGIDLSAEDIDDSIRKPIVLCVTNDFYRKGVDYLIETAILVQKLAPQVQFLVIGKDDTFKPEKLPSNVKFLGPIYGEEALGCYFREASVFFLPYRFDRNPHVLVEAMSAALPLVASEQGGSIELISGNNTGYLVQIGDIRGYTDAIIKLISDRSLRNTMGRVGQDLMRKMYNWDSIAKRIVFLIAQNIKGHAS
jgi:glycosyltransferase involved in cell wall biosynthesis